MVGGSPKCGVRRQMLIFSMTIPLWVMKEPLVCSRFILNGPNFSPLIFGSFHPLERKRSGRTQSRIPLALRFHAYYYN